MGDYCLLIWALLAMGGDFTLEHPLRSRVWSHPLLRSLGSLSNISTVTLDQSRFGLHPSDSPEARYRKPTKILGSPSTLWKLGRRHWVESYFA